MKRNRLAVLIGASIAAAAFSSLVSADQITNWELDLTGVSAPVAGGDTTGISNLAFNGESYIVNSGPGPTFTFTDVGVFNIIQYNGGLGLHLNGGELTAAFSGSGTTNITTGTFAFNAGGTLDFYFQNAGDFGTSALNDYGANNGTNVAHFVQLAGGGGSVNPDGTPTSNGTVTATFQLVTDTAGVWKDLGTDLPLLLTLGFVTTNASEDNQVGTPSFDTNLALALSGSSSTLNAPPGHFFVNNGGQFKLESVPEPATIGLLGIGLLGMGIGLRRRSA